MYAPARDCGMEEKKKKVISGFPRLLIVSGLAGIGDGEEPVAAWSFILFEGQNKVRL